MIVKHKQSDILDLSTKYLHKMLLHLNLGILIFVISTSLLDDAHGCSRRRRYCPSKLSMIIVALILLIICSRKVKPWSQGWLIAAGAYPGFCSIKRLEVFLLPLDRVLVHRRSLPRILVRFPQQIAGTHLYTWVERGTVRVKCLAQEHNTLSPARARTRTARSGVERTNHEATAPPTFVHVLR